MFETDDDKFDGDDFEKWNSWEERKVLKKMRMMRGRGGVGFVERVKGRRAPFANQKKDLVPANDRGSQYVVNIEGSSIDAIARIGDLYYVKSWRFTRI